MQSYLVVGGTSQERNQKGITILEKYQVDSLDRLILKAEKNKKMGIDQVRQLQHQLSFKPYRSSIKAAFILEADKLTRPAQNAMLKLLEEPPRNTIIILASPNPDLLLDTIVSRCQIISLSPKSQLAFDQKMINCQLDILDSILKAGVGERFKIAAEIGKDRQGSLDFCQAQLAIWRKKMRTSQNKKIVNLIRKIQRTLAKLEANVNPKLAIENLLLYYPKAA